MPSRFTVASSRPNRIARRAVTASARVLELSPRPDVRQTSIPAWQAQAWSFFDQIGEVRYGARYYGNSLSRLRLYVGWRESASDPVVPVDLEDPPDGFSRDQYLLAAAMVARLHSTDGSVSELLRAYGVNLFVAGEGYLVGRIDPETGRERWDYLSVDQVVWHESRWKLRESAGDTPDRYVPLDPEQDVVIRIWQPHPRFANEADAPMRAVLTVCEELLLLSANVRASALSRIPAGILVIPDTALEGGPDDLDSSGVDGASRADRTMSDLVDHFITPISDPGSASAVVPYLLALDPADVDKVKLIETSRSVDEVAAAQRAELLVRLANGVDLPPEVLTGLSNTNHWNAWLIDEQSFRTHLAPAAQLFCSALTEGLVWPTISASGLTPDPRLVVGFDPADLVGHPDRKENAKDGHSSLVISDEAYRRALGFGDEDAPDEDEYRRRVARAQGTQALAPVAVGEIDSVVESLRVATGQIAAGETEGAEGAEVVVDESRSGDEPSEVVAGPPDAVTAAGTPDADRFGEMVGKIDRALMDRLEALASASLRRALERAGARLRSRVSRNQDLKPVLSETMNTELVSVLGRDAIVAAGLTDEDLLDGTGDDLEEEYLALVGLAQKRIRTYLRDGFGLGESELAALELKQEQDRVAGWGVLAAGLTALAAGLLYDPRPGRGVDAVGEFDPTSRVPGVLIRDTLVTAGGGEVGPSSSPGETPLSPVGVRPTGTEPGVIDGAGPTAAPSAQPTSAGLVGGGPTTKQAAARVGLEQVGFIWDYGNALRQTFEPHLDLDGERFAGWDDVALTNLGDWPPTPFLYPGDHDGCLCVDRPIFRVVTVGADEDELDDELDGDDA